MFMPAPSEVFLTCIQNDNYSSFERGTVTIAIMASKTNLSRRHVLRGMLSTALIPALSHAQEAKPWWLGNGMPQETQSTPKIACQIDLRNGITDEKVRAIVQMGVYHVLANGPALPWQASDLQSTINQLKAGGLTLGNLFIGGFPNATYGRPGRDEEIDKVKRSMRPRAKLVSRCSSTTSTLIARPKAISSRPGAGAQD
jgi:hypothetical protein